MINSFEDLVVWQKAMDLVVDVYRIVKLLPKEELYALSDQMRRAAVSIPSNIAEGKGRNSTKEYVNFLSIAKGSTAELRTQLMICKRLLYINDQELEQSLRISEEVGKMLTSLSASLSST